MALSAKQIAETEKKRNAVKKEYYKALLDQFCRKIKTASELGTRQTIVTVPPFMVGFPKYNLATTVAYMSRQLMRLGYRTELVGPLDISVKWSKERPVVPHHEAPEELPMLINLHSLANKVRSSNTRK